MQFSVLSKQSNKKEKKNIRVFVATKTKVKNRY